MPRRRRDTGGEWRRASRGALVPRSRFSSACPSAPRLARLSLGGAGRSPPAVANQLTVLWELDLLAGNNQRRAVTDGAAIDVSLGVSGITEARNCRLGSGRRAV